MKGQYGPGFFRMKKRLGDDAFEQLREDTIKQQQAMREKVSGEKITARDRTTYKDYPHAKK